MKIDKAYNIISDILFKGFITISVDLMGHRIVFKTLNENEYHNIRFLSGNNTDLNYMLKFNIYFLIYSTFVIDHENALDKNNENIKILFKFFSTFPSKLIERLIKELNSLKEEASEVGAWMESFCYTSYSKRKWKSYKNKNLNSECCTGIKGTSFLGLNSFQEYWITINNRLDEEESHNKQLSFSYLIASASNPKGVKTARSMFDASVEDLEEKRWKLAKYGPSEETKWTPNGWAAPVDTVEDLVDELNRQKQGIKDKHDLFMEAHLARLKKKAEDFVNKEKENLDRVREKRAKEGLPALMGGQRIATQEEIDQFINKTKNNNLVILPPEEESKEDNNNRFLRKMGSKIIEPKGI